MAEISQECERSLVKATALAERRRHPRHPIEAQIFVLYPEFWRETEFNKLLGWTHNVSEGGVCFSLPDQLPGGDVVLHIDYEGMGAEYVLAKVIHEYASEEDGWRYHCRIERTLASIGALDCLEV